MLKLRYNARSAARIALEKGVWGVSEKAKALWAKVLVNKPRSLVAVWREDYTRAYLLLGLLPR
jgi:hypothetical protein